MAKKAQQKFCSMWKSFGGKAFERVALEENGSRNLESVEF